MKPEEVAAIVDRHGGSRGGLIAVLGDVQGKYGYLPEDALRIVAERTGTPLTEVYGVATFYRWFTLKPRGRHLVSCCVGTACHVRGSPKVVEAFRDRLRVAPGETTADREFTFETVNCLGACALGPIVVADGHYFADVDARKVPDILSRASAGMDDVDVGADASHVFPVEVSCPRCNHSLMDRRYLIDGTPPIRVTVSFGDRHGWLLLSSVYGSYTIQPEHPIPDDAVVDFFCPHCHGELKAAAGCPACGSPIVPMIVRGGGVLQICSRRGCRAHMLDLDGANA